ncbi:hypothetical protein [Planococcus rifietoensis]|uniref:hypothetical protein n=1 Tax=Planococcus rifietoensis TaxID=200991 RepID=UPI00384FC4ED
MPKYRVIKDFTDLQDEDHIYRVDHKYPRKGRAKKERIDELLSSENNHKEPLIEEVEE